MIGKAASCYQTTTDPFFSGQVNGQTGDFFHIQTADGVIKARKAGSCLLLPGLDDRVLIYAEGEENFILAILSRPHQQQENELSFSGPTRIRVNQGDLNLQAPGEIKLAAEQRIDLVSSEIRAHANRAEANIEQCNFFGRLLKVQVEVIKSAARTMEQLAKRWTLQTDNSLRYIKEHDETQTESARYLAGQTLTVHAKNSVHTAEELVSINGSQINLS